MGKSTPNGHFGTQEYVNSDGDNICCTKDETEWIQPKHGEFFNLQVPDDFRRI